MSILHLGAHVMRIGLRLRSPRLKTGVLAERHVAEAAALLSREFCRREPLCGLVGLTEAQMTPFFLQLVAFVAAQGLGIVAYDHAGKVRGVLTVEDHRRLFVPDPRVELELPEGLAAISAYLEQTELPDDLQPSALRRLYYCGLAAVDSGPKDKTILPQMMIAAFFHLKALGYTHGYAKVTNAAIVRRFRELERYAFARVFTARAAGEPAAFVYRGQKPFEAYSGQTFLFSWAMA